MTATRVAILCDLREEEWPSMDLVADMLLNHLQSDYPGAIEATRICPPMRRQFSRVDPTSNGHQKSDLKGKRFNADRVLNRFWDYPRYVRQLRSQFDLFHLVDHSYGQLVHELPAERTIVTCHDLDTFQCLLNPDQEPRSFAFRKMMGRTLSGFRKAARVTCDSKATRDELLTHQLIAPERTVVIPNGVHPSFSPVADPTADAEATRLLGAADDNAIDLLHVGSTIHRKRIDILLRVVAGVRKQFPTARLLRVGGPFTTEQARLVRELELEDAILVLPRLESSVLAAVYRRATVLLLPSDREGFGLPVVEAMACGTNVIASDLPVLREVGGNAALYCPVADVSVWTKELIEILAAENRQSRSWSDRREAGITQAAKFTWAEYARKTVDVYNELLK